ncbi:MAG: hypothetical protein ABL897_01170 [Hyphomicrobium sp.]
MARFALVQNGVTINLIEWDGVCEYTPPKGCELVPERDAPKFTPQTVSHDKVKRARIFDDQ